MSLEVPKFDPQVFLQVTLRWDSEDKEVLTQLAARIDKEVWQDPDHLVGVNRVVSTGLKPTDKVIVNGTQRAVPGQKVTIEPEQPAKAG